MRSVTFNFRPEVPQRRQDELLEGISGWDAVHGASRVNPTATVPLLKRMAFAYLEDSADVELVVRRLRELPEIESADSPPERRLIR